MKTHGHWNRSPLVRRVFFQCFTRFIELSKGLIAKMARMPREMGEIKNAFSSHCIVYITNDL